MVEAEKSFEEEGAMSQMRTDDMLEMVRRDVGALDQLETKAPADVQDFLNSTAFWDAAEQSYETLDVDGSGSIEAEVWVPAHLFIYI